MILHLVMILTQILWEMNEIMLKTSVSQTDEDESREVVPIDLEDKAECSSTDIGLSNNVSDSDSSYAR